MIKTYSAGIVTAYGAAKRAGYTGTYEDFCRQQAEYAESAAAVEQAKNTAVSAANTATTKAGEATTAATDAQTAKTQTEAAASQALTDISTARSVAISAVQTVGQSQTSNATAQALAAAQSATTASTKASEASASATSAGQSATNAAASATSAASSASAAQAVLESIPEEYSDLSEDVDKLKADLDELQEGGYIADTQQIQSKVNAWLTQHPEATTTVLDGSITEVKFSDALKLKTTKDYITPEMFGAVGDGSADDTTAVRNALKYSIDNGVKLLLTKTYYITASLLTSSDYNGTVVVNIEGTRPLKNYIYAVDSYGGIKFANGLNVFDGITIQGSIYRVSFMPVSRTQTGSIFHECAIRTFTFDSCSVSNILAFCHNTSIGSVSQISNNRFLDVYYFAKCDSQSAHYGCIDSKISGNYINGASAINDNHCFEFWSFNGSSVIDNFIDYYQTIYYPVSDVSFAFQGPVSVGNQYQVFRYLYFRAENCTQISFNSVSDCFNNTDVTKLARLRSFVVYTYTGHDGNTHDYPPCIMLIGQTDEIVIKDAIIQQNCESLVFIRHALTNYSYAKAELTLNIASSAFSRFSYNRMVTHADSLYNAGSHKWNQIKIPFILDLESLPTLSFGWTNYYIGQLIRVNNTIYKFVALYNENTSTYNATWVDVTANI